MGNKYSAIIFFLLALGLSAALGTMIYLITLLANDNVAPVEHYSTCDVFCQGPILHTIQNAHIFNDSKEFVDMPLKVTPEEVLKAFEELPNYGKKTLEAFVNKYFLPAGSDLEKVSPSDFQDVPQTLHLALNGNKYYDWALDLNLIWKSLLRQPKVEDPNRHTLLPWKNPVVIPGGRFRESYYWDTYWIILGLLKWDMKETAKGLVLNFLDSIRDNGFIPNGARIYYLTRSQPPFLAEMISELYAADAISKEFLLDSLPVLESEHHFWMNETRKALINGHSLTKYTGGEDNTPRPESYREDLETAAENIRPDGEVFIDLRAGAESGWDYTTRWFENGSPSINDIDTTNVVPVDLNIILLRYERFLEKTFRDFGNSKKANEYEAFANARETAIETVLWDESKSIWRDWRLREGKWSNIISVANFLPLWAGLGTVGERKQSILKALNESGLVRIGGVATTNVDSGQQWDGDNAWPPLQDLIVEGLLEGGDKEGKEMAIEIVKNWLESGYLAWKKDGAMIEKYLASKPGVGGGGGEYEVQLGFGWTNGVALKMMVKFSEYL